MSLARLPMCADRINRTYKDYTLLDVGCRTKDLEPLLNNCKEYFGSDLIPAEGVLPCDLNKTLPFEDNQFDISCALDVLEHLDNPHFALQELFRITRKTVFISLPNMYYITFRLNFLRGQGISGKYRFESEPILDRHRWVLSYSEALNFVYRNSPDYTVEHEPILPIRNRTKAISQPLEKWLSNYYPNLFIYGVLFEIKLNKSFEDIK